MSKQATTRYRPKEWRSRVATGTNDIKIAERDGSGGVCVIPYRYSDRLAKARRIQALPELLRACEAALDTLEDKYNAGDSETAKILRAAITKATGETA